MTDLLGLAAELVGVASVSHEEAALAGLVEARLRERPGLEVTRVGDNVVARTHLGRPERLLLAGHLDTVPASGPPFGEAVARLEGGVLHGLGAVDMKGGLAVQLDLALGLATEGPDAPRRDATFVFYAREEVARRHSGLLELKAAEPGLLAADAAILGEPTGGLVEAGCQGVLRARVTVRGARAHVARYWTGENAVHRLAPVLARLAEFPGRRPVVEGCEYHESLQAVSVTGGVAGNVVPDEATVLVGHRFAPDRDAESAWEWLEGYLAPALDREAGDRLEREEAAPASAPGLGHPALGALVRASGRPPRAKLGWTDVAFFAEEGIPAANFGPGDPLLAHTPNEQVSRSELELVSAALRGLLAPG